MRAGCAGRVRSQILLANDAVLTDEKGHDAGGVVGRGPGHEREAVGSRGARILKR